MKRGRPAQQVVRKLPRGKCRVDLSKRRIRSKLKALTKVPGLSGTQRTQAKGHGLTFFSGVC